MNINWIWYLGLGYLLGSIPFALVIGKLFYKTDVRNFGSGNLGSTNAGRVLGKKAGISVIVCDVVKVVVVVGVVSCFDLEASIWAGFAAAFGHCYPVFAGFRGGKAVATMFGFLLSTSIFTFQSAWYLIVPFAVFLVVRYAGKMVSLSSISADFTSSIYVRLTIIQDISVEIVAASWLLTILVIYRPRANIVKIKNGTENKISWL